MQFTTLNIVVVFAYISYCWCHEARLNPADALHLSDDQYWSLDLQMLQDQLEEFDDELALDYGDATIPQMETARILWLLRRREEIVESRNTFRTSLTFVRPPNSVASIRPVLSKRWSPALIFLIALICFSYTVLQCV